MPNEPLRILAVDDVRENLIALFDRLLQVVLHTQPLQFGLCKLLPCRHACCGSAFQCLKQIVRLFQRCCEIFNTSGMQPPCAVEVDELQHQITSDDFNFSFCDAVP